MKLVFAKEMQSLDQQSAEQIGLPTMVLMENAGKAVAETAADFLEDCFGKNIVVFTGKGNNGGDGFAAARWLSNQGARVKVFLVSPWQELTGDAAAQLRICRKCGIELFALKEDRGSWDVAEVSCRHTPGPEWGLRRPHCPPQAPGRAPLPPAPARPGVGR